jgi:uncharacterized membrane protein
MSEEQNQVQIRSQSVMYSGPLPTAGEFKEYEQALPGAADRILSMAEAQAEFRRKTDAKLIEHSIKKSGLGQIFAFIISILSIGAIFASIFLNQPLAAVAPAIMALSSLATVFIGKNH